MDDRQAENSWISESLRILLYSGVLEKRVVRRLHRVVFLAECAYPTFPREKTFFALT